MSITNLGLGIVLEYSIKVIFLQPFPVEHLTPKNARALWGHIPENFSSTKCQPSLLTELSSVFKMYCYHVDMRHCFYTRITIHKAIKILSPQKYLTAAEKRCYFFSNFETGK